MEGDIKVKSKLKKGSNFIIAFPATVGIEIPAFQDTPEDGKYELPIQTLNGLLLDDIPENTFIMRELLVKHGMQAVCVNDGEKALELCLAEHFDFVVTDLRMPRMSGQTFISELRRHERAAKRRPVPIVVVTAENSVEEKRLCLSQYGANEYLLKPIKQVQLLEAIARSRVAQQLRHKHIFLVEDDVISAQVLSTFLRRAGHTCTHVPTIAEVRLLPIRRRSKNSNPMLKSMMPSCSTHTCLTAWAWTL